MVQEFVPIETIVDGAAMDYQVEGSGKKYIDLNNSKLEVRVKLTTSTGGKIATAAKMGTVKLPLQSLFQSVTMKIAVKVLTESKNVCPFRALFVTVLN